MRQRQAVSKRCCCLCVRVYSHSVSLNSSKTGLGFKVAHAECCSCELNRAGVDLNKSSHHRHDITCLILAFTIGSMAGVHSRAYLYLERALRECHGLSLAPDHSILWNSDSLADRGTRGINKSETSSLNSHTFNLCDDQRTSG
jgi:hypothetical protein